jgi:hypothetical protein
MDHCIYPGAGFMAGLQISDIQANGVLVVAAERADIAISQAQTVPIGSQVSKGGTDPSSSAGYKHLFLVFHDQPSSN